jgi:ribosomal protein S18 acetylase RimI-like enzyme
MIEYHALDPRTITSQNIAEMNLLLPQLTTKADPLTIDYLRTVTEHSLIIVARDARKTIKAMATLVPVYKPTGMCTLVEDVVVDGSLRGFHVGETLMRDLMQETDRCGIGRVELTSKAERIAANLLYRKLGFKLRITNPYELTL